MGENYFRHSSAGYKALMKSGAMVSVLHSYSDLIESLASGEIGPDRYGELDRPPYASYDFVTKERAGVRVQTNNPHARLAEAKHGHLKNAAGV